MRELKAIYKGVHSGKQKYEVGGVIFNATSHEEAIQKYLRQSKRKETKRC